jgi:hypothetical protein
MPAKRPEGPALCGQRPPVLARAVSAQVKLANPVYSVRCADRGPAPITCLVHLLPPAGPLPGPGAQSAALVSNCSACTSASLPGRLSRHQRHRPHQSQFAQRRSSSSCLGDALRRPAQPAQGGGSATRTPAASPPINTERPLPLPDTGAAANKDSGTTAKPHADVEPWTVRAGQERPYPGSEIPLR